MPQISVIVPVFNGAGTLPLCLKSLKDSDYPEMEIVVVDDASTDSSPQIARDLGVRVVSKGERSGPAAARNLGAAESMSGLLLFIDADVTVETNTLSKVVRRFENDPGLNALFGSYDTTPGAKNFLSQYKNLFHHYVHQNSKEDASTFWAGCGAIRKKTFEALGGFDSSAYPHPSIEDIDLGLRLKKAGGKILLAKEVQVKHLKRWTWRSLLRAEIFYRAVPWSQLILKSRFLPSDLNLEPSQRLSAALTGLFLLSLLWMILFPGFLPAVVAIFSAILIVSLNKTFYRFFLKQKGLLFTICVFPCHLLYYFYSSLTFAFCWLRFHVRRNKKQNESLRPTVVE